MGRLGATRTRSARAAIVAGVLAACGCADLGDSSAIPGAPSEDGTTSAASYSDDGSALVSEDGSIALDDASVPAFEAGSDDAGSVSLGSDDAGITEGGAEDATLEIDAGVDATIADGSIPDATLEDTGGPDTGGLVVPDAGVDSGAGHDSGAAADAGTDSGHAASLIPCTTAGQTGCVLCQFNNGGSGTRPNATQLCTPTEAALVAHDIASGLAIAAGPDPDPSCYACAAEQGCLDDSEFNDEGHECEDLSGATNVADCESTLACILGSSCGFASGALSACYCGTAPVSGTCAAVGASNGANGACKTTEAAGFGLSATDGLDILKNFTSTTLPSGVANNIFQCAASNSCTACLH